MVSSPNLAFFQTESEGTWLWCSSPRNSQEWVVCSLFPRFSKTDTTLGCSMNQIVKGQCRQTGKQRICAVPWAAGKPTYWRSPLPRGPQWSQRSHWCASCRSRTWHLWHHPGCKNRSSYPRTWARDAWDLGIGKWGGGATRIWDVYMHLPRKDPRKSQWDWVTRLYSSSADPDSNSSGGCECAPK